MIKWLPFFIHPVYNEIFSIKRRQDKRNLSCSIRQKLYLTFLFGFCCCLHSMVQYVCVQKMDRLLVDTGYNRIQTDDFLMYLFPKLLNITSTLRCVRKQTYINSQLKSQCNPKEALNDNKTSLLTSVCEVVVSRTHSVIRSLPKL